MNEKAYTYLKDIGIDLNDNIHPFAKEFNLVKKLNNPFISKSFEHLILKLILDLKVIEVYNDDDYKYYIKRVKKRIFRFGARDLKYFGIPH